MPFVLQRLPGLWLSLLLILPRAASMQAALVVKPGVRVSASPAGAASAGNASAVSAGFMHTCALTRWGGVKCWGYNGEGELGNGTSTQQDTPVDVIGLSAGARAVSAGYFHTCALTDAGGVKCWGDNREGQLGNGATVQQDTPVDVVGLLAGVSAIAAGYYHTCALTDAGGVKCWGDNRLGQLGDGTTEDRWTAVDVLGLTAGVSAIAAGMDHTCALTQAGGVKCWGYNGDGELGDGSGVQQDTPVDVLGLTEGVSAIAAGYYHTCALTQDGGVKCRGDNYSGELGDGTQTYAYAPVDVVGLSSGVSALALGQDHTCALTQGGAVQCWGSNHSDQLGDGTTTDRHTPVDVLGLSASVSALAAGGGHTCALTQSGGVECWGDNYYGQLGDDTQTNRSTPVDVVGLGLSQAFLPCVTSSYFSGQ